MAVDDGARTRYLGRDSREEARNLLESGGTDGSFQCPEELSVNDDVPLLCPGRCPADLCLSTESPRKHVQTIRCNFPLPRGPVPCEVATKYLAFAFLMFPEELRQNCRDKSAVSLPFPGHHQSDSLESKA